MALDLAYGTLIDKRVDHLVLERGRVVSNGELTCPLGQQRARARVKLIQQCTFPIAPHSRPNAVQVGISEQKKHVKHIQIANLSGKIGRQARLAQIAALREVGHQDVLFD